MIKFVNHLLHAQASLLPILKRKLFLVRVQVLQPVLRIQALNLLVELDQRSLRVTDDLNVRSDHFVHLRWINIHMNNLGVSPEFVGLSYDAVVKPRTNIENEVRFNDRLVGVCGSMHSQHA